MTKRSKCEICSRYFRKKSYHDGTRLRACFTCHVLYRKNIEIVLKLGCKTLPFPIKKGYTMKVVEAWSEASFKKYGIGVDEAAKTFKL